MRAVYKRPVLLPLLCTLAWKVSWACGMAMTFKHIYHTKQMENDGGANKMYGSNYPCGISWNGMLQRIMGLSGSAGYLATSPAGKPLCVQERPVNHCFWLTSSPIQTLWKSNIACVKNVKDNLRNASCFVNSLLCCVCWKIYFIVSPLYSGFGKYSDPFTLLHTSLRY